MTARLNGCHDRKPFVRSTRVQDGWIDMRDGAGFPSRVAHMVDVPFRMTPECQYTHTDLGQADKGCAGCKHRVEGVA